MRAADPCRHATHIYIQLYRHTVTAHTQTQAPTNTQTPTNTHKHTQTQTHKHTIYTNLSFNLARIIYLFILSNFEI